MEQLEMGSLSVIKEIGASMMQRAAERDAREASTPTAPKAPKLSKQEIEQAQEIGFSARLLVQATLPHSKLDPVCEYERSNGLISISINARKRYGLPYGTYPRLLLAWMTTEAVRTGSPELWLGRSLAAFLAKLDLGKSGGQHGSVPRLRQHMQRLFTSSVSLTKETEGALYNVLIAPVEQCMLLWDPKRPNQQTLWQSRIRLSPLFYDEITNRPVPIDMAALRALAKGRSPMAIDIYQWLTYRMSRVDKAITIPWRLLALQFGAGYQREVDFRRKFARHLKRVHELYPQANVEPTRAGLTLRPSSTHVPMRLVRGGSR